MSEQDIDITAGRLLRQRVEGLKRKAAIEADLKALENALSAVLKAAGQAGSAEKRRAELQPFSKFLSVDGIVGMLDERDRIQKDIFDAIRLLREMGYES